LYVEKERVQKMSKVLGIGSTKPIKDDMAVKLGLYEAFVLQQVHYWLLQSKHEIEGRMWVYNTYEDWNKQLPFMSLSTVKRAILKLEKQGILISGCFNKFRIDKTKWYTINYDLLDEMDLLTAEDVDLLYQIQDESKESDEQSEMDNWSGFTDLPDSSENDVRRTSENKAIPKSTSEITKKNTISIGLVTEVIDYLNKKLNSHYRANNEQIIKLIKKRQEEGYGFKDFKIVIDKKFTEWSHHHYWSRFLRPQTLFGDKFEMYLNQPIFRNVMSMDDFDFEE